MLVQFSLGSCASAMRRMHHQGKEPARQRNSPKVNLQPEPKLNPAQLKCRLEWSCPAQSSLDQPNYSDLQLCMARTWEEMPHVSRYWVLGWFVRQHQLPDTWQKWTVAWNSSTGWFFEAPFSLSVWLAATEKEISETLHQPNLALSALPWSTVSILNTWGLQGCSSCDRLPGWGGGSRWPHLFGETFLTSCQDLV